MEAWIDGVMVLVQGDGFYADVFVQQEENGDKKEITLTGEVTDWYDTNWDEIKNPSNKLVDQSPQIIEAALKEAEDAVEWPELE